MAIQFPGVQYIPGVGYVTSHDNVPSPNPYAQQPRSALNGDQDVMMISGLNGVGDGTATPTQQPPLGLFANLTSSPIAMLLIGVLVGFLLGSMGLTSSPAKE